MCEKIQEKIKVRFEDVENDSLLLESTILDLRFKRHSFKSEDAFKRACEKVAQKARNVIIFEAGPEPDEETPHASTRKSKNSGCYC